MTGMPWVTGRHWVSMVLWESRVLWVLNIGKLIAEKNKGVVGVKVTVEMCLNCVRAVVWTTTPIVNDQRVVHDLDGYWRMAWMVGDWLQNWRKLQSNLLSHHASVVSVLQQLLLHYLASYQPD